MENESVKSFSRPCFSPGSSTTNLAEIDINDPISAYFRKRCSNSSRTFFTKNLGSDSDSSIGVIDVDSVSVFGDEEENDNENFKLMRKSFPVIERVKDNKKAERNKQYSDVSSTHIFDSELQLEKQRVLAQIALKTINDKNNETLNEDSVNGIEKSSENQVLIDLASKFNANLEISKETRKNWFRPNYSPDTPRYFNDELSSIGGEDSALAKSKIKQSLPQAESCMKTRHSKYTKNMNSILKELNQNDLKADLEFKAQTKEEKINRFEEDEKLFKLENSALLHNSNISQFSGVGGKEILIGSSEFSNLNQMESENKKISIGQFFNMRSNRVSSLIGSAVDDENVSLSTTTKKEDENSFLHEQSLPISNVSKTENLKPRRCVSTYDLKPNSEMSKTGRYSNDSCTSNSTVMIQNILAEMESGLSGTEVYEKLIKTFVPNKITKKNKTPNKRELQGNNETPKTSKISKRIEHTNKPKEFDGEKHLKNFKQGVQSLEKTPPSNYEFRESKPEKESEKLDSNQGISLLREDKIKQLKGKKGFDASTPKLQHLKSQDDRFKNACNNVLMEKEDWEAPRISAIQPTIDFNKTVFSEENEKTFTGYSNCTILGLDSSKKNNTVLINDTCNMEDTIIAGDLTVLSQRIEEMKEDGVCIVRSADAEEPILLTVVQKLADFPKGSVDCTALTPLLRDQFPELLSTFPTPSSDQTVNRTSLSISCKKTQDLLVSESGCWIKLPIRIGFNEKIYAFVEVKKTISVPLSNTSKNWLLISIESVTLIHSNGSNLPGVKKNNQWNVSDFIEISMKDTIVSPESQKSLEVSFTSKVPTKIEIKISFILKQLLGKEFQLRSVNIRTHNLNPLNSINVIPKDSINFGVIADQCFDQRTIQLTFDGVCGLPLTVFITEEDSQSQNFFLKPLISSTEEAKDGDWKDGKFHHFLREGEKQLLEFLVFFQPNAFVNGGEKIQNFKALLTLKIDTDTDSDGVLQKIPIKGSAGFAKFLWNSSCSPFVFRVSEKGQSLTRSFPLKNVGSLPIAFSIKIENEESQAEEKDEIFVAPKSFYLSKNEESSINITFNAKSNESCVKRLLTLQIKPNGRAKYEVELIGILCRNESRPSSRSSNASASTKSLPNTESGPVKLLTTAQVLSWASVPLDKEMRQTFQLKNVSTFAITTRITFKHNLGSFMLVNENGEKVQKIRKVLKPNCPFSLTVAFRPDLLGEHHNAVFVETNQRGGKKMILLNGIGGVPNLFLGNVKSDLNGCKMVILQNPSSNNHFFSNIIEFKNGGRIPGFILIKPSMEVMSLSHELIVTPSCCVVPPDAKVVIKLSQKLKNEDLRHLLSGKDISKLATLSVIMGDEISRLRLRKLIGNKKVKISDRSKMLIGTFEGEKELKIKRFEDSSVFENQFFKSLKTVEVAVVVERTSGIWETTVLVDEDETVDGFTTICSAVDSTVASTITLDSSTRTEERLQNSKNKSSSFDKTIFLLDPSPPQNKITKWLETLDYPLFKPA